MILSTVQREPYYTGHPYDGALNLYYAHNRFYDAQTGQWISEDPAEDGLNWYAYCGNNPVSRVDILGLRPSQTKKLEQNFSMTGVELKYGYYFVMDGSENYEERKALHEEAEESLWGMRRYDEWYLTEIINNVEQDDVIIYALVSTDQTRLSPEQQLTNAEYIYNYLIKEGWSKEAICGLLGNIQIESWFNPGVWQKMNNLDLGYGIVQWSPARDKIFKSLKCETVEDLNKMAMEEPKKLLDEQLKYLIYSSRATTNSGEKEWYATLSLSYGSPYKMTYEEYIVSNCDVGDLALVFHASYERSDRDESEEQRRVESAEQWYEYFNSK